MRCAMQRKPQYVHAVCDRTATAKEMAFILMRCQTVIRVKTIHYIQLHREYNVYSECVCIYYVYI